MASISKDPNGNRCVQFVAADKKRRSIRLGKVSHEAAREIRDRIEALNKANIMQQDPSRSVAEWVRDLDDSMAGNAT